MKATNVLNLLIAASLSGCYIGPGGICGPQAPIYYCQSKADQEKMRPKPYGAHWVKEGMTRESRRVDSWACGAADTVIAADSPVFPDSVIDMERMQSEQNDFGPRARLLERWSVCMSSKGYQFVGIGNCDERCLYP